MCDLLWPGNCSILLCHISSIVIALCYIRFSPQAVLRRWEALSLSRHDSALLISAWLLDTALSTSLLLHGTSARVTSNAVVRFLVSSLKLDIVEGDRGTGYSASSTAALSCVGSVADACEHCPQLPRALLVARLLQVRGGVCGCSCCYAITLCCVCARV